MLEKWKSAVDKGKSFGPLLTYLSKTFDWLSQKLLLTKPHAYVVDIVALRLIHTDLTNTKRRTKLSLPYNPWEEI